MLAPSASKSESSRPDSLRSAASDCIASGAWETCHRPPPRLPRCPCPPPSPGSRVFGGCWSVWGTSPRASAAASCSAWPRRSERSFLISSIFDLILFWLFFNWVGPIQTHFNRHSVHDNCVCSCGVVSWVVVGGRVCVFNCVWFIIIDSCGPFGVDWCGGCRWCCVTVRRWGDAKRETKRDSCSIRLANLRIFVCLASQK